MLLKDIKNNCRKSSGKLLPGEYNAVITYAGNDPDYVDGEAWKICYTLTDENDVEYVYSETFINNAYNKRTIDFEKYLQTNGLSLQNIDTLNGCKEKLTLKKHQQYGRTYLNITQRKFVSHA